MEYVILDWTHKRYCWVSTQIPDKKLPGALICRSTKQIWQGKTDLLLDWKYEPNFKQYEKEHLQKDGTEINLS